MKDWQQLLIGFALLVIFADALQSFAARCPEAPVKSPSENQQSPYSTKKNCAPNQSFIVKGFIVTVDFVEHREHFFVAAGTIVIAIFTIILALATVRLWHSTNILGRRAHEEFVATNRARLRIRWFFSLNISAGQPITMRIAAANIGGTAARIHSTGVTFFPRTLGQPGPAEFPIQQQPVPGGVLVAEPGQQVTVEVSGAALPPEVWVAINATPPSAELCMVGTILYRDANNTMRITGFFRIYDATRNRFKKTTPSDEFIELDYED